MKRKRHSCEKINEIEDGGRAIVIDEAISALVFEYAKMHNYFEVFLRSMKNSCNQAGF